MEKLFKYKVKDEEIIFSFEPLSIFLLIILFPVEKDVPITDIARRADVSTVQVSYVMNTREKAKRVSGGTVEKTREAAGEDMSVNSLYYARENCTRIPEDIDFIGFDGKGLFDLYPGNLSYIRQPIDEMGHEVVKLLVETMNCSNLVSRIQIDPGLVTR